MSPEETQNQHLQSQHAECYHDNRHQGEAMIHYIVVNFLEDVKPGN